MVEETEQPGGKTLTLDGLPLICNTLTAGFDPGMASESFNQRLLTLKRFSTGTNLLINEAVTK